MGIVKKEDIRGVRIENQILCAKCISDEGQYTSDALIMKWDIEKDNDKLYFCDECKERLV